MSTRTRNLNSFSSQKKFGNKTKAGSKVQRCMESSTVFDFFGASFSMNIDDDVSAVKSRTGCIFTLFLILLTLLYTYQKIEVLVEQSDTSIAIHEEEDHFSDTYKFGYDQGFNIAVAFTGYNNLRENELPPEIGYFRYRVWEWGYHSNNQTYWGRHTVLDSHNCSREELGLDGDTEDATFMPVIESQRP